MGLSRIDNGDWPPWVEETWEATEKELNPLLFRLPVSKRGTSLGWGQDAWVPGVGDGCICPEGENNTLDCRRAGGSVGMRTSPLPGLGHKPQCKNNLGLDVWGPVRTGQDRSPHPLLASNSHLSCLPHHLLFLSPFIQGRRCCLLYCPSPHTLPKQAPLPQPLSIPEPCLNFLWAYRSCPVSALVPFLHPHPDPRLCACIFVAVPCPKVSLPFISTHVFSPSGERPGGGPRAPPGPLTLLCAPNHPGLSVLDFSEKRRPPGAS